MSDPILYLSHIMRTFNAGQSNEVRVLRGVDLTLKPGEMVALTAPSGSGKSTLLQISGLLDQPSGGVLRIDGVDMIGASDKLRTQTRGQKIGFVYQFHHLLPNFTALENCVIPQRVNGIPLAQSIKRAEAFLDRVGLATRALHRPDALSGGEQQRVAICRAMMNNPKLLLADEPTGNLDPKTSQSVFALLRELITQRGMSALVATHNHELAAQMDRIVTLKDGVLVT